MNKCDCYHSAEKIICWPPDEAPITIETGSCWGTKEREECHCYGDRTQCDFYPEVRAKAKKELKKNSTNAANIRSMSDKKLAEFLVDIGWDCCFCSEHERLENEPLLRGEKCDEQCVKHCLKWLKQTVKEQ